MIVDRGGGVNGVDRILGRDGIAENVGRIAGCKGEPIPYDTTAAHCIFPPLLAII
jgi:hypothetical protein